MAVPFYYAKYNYGGDTMGNLTNGSLMDKRWVTEVVQESAKYLLDIFKDENANVAAVVSSLAQMCIDTKH